jgi:hypothetical protein
MRDVLPRGGLMRSILTAHRTPPLIKQQQWQARRALNRVHQMPSSSVSVVDQSIKNLLIFHHFAV